MASGQWGLVLRQVQRIFHGGSVAGLSEGQLLDRFVKTGDEVAFSAIVARHGPMVLGVCRGVLRDPNAIDDAFQATFLILVKKARSLRDRDLLGPWLYGVARRVALRARADAARRHRLETRPATERFGPDVTLEAELRELQSLIREEVDLLSNHDRMAVVLCYLEGLTHEEAADRLGWPIGTVKGRLARARNQLRDRLSRRGVTLPAVFAGNLGQNLPNLVPPSLIQTTTLAATRLAAGQPLTTGIISTHALSLSEGVIGTMFSTQLKFGLTAVAVTCAVAIPGVLAYQGGPQPANQAQVPPPGNAPPDEPSKPALAAKPAARSGAGRLPEASDYIEGIVQGLENYNKTEAGSSTSEEQLYLWSKRLVEATQASLPVADWKSTLQAHHDRMKATRARLEHRRIMPRNNDADVILARSRELEAEGWLAKGRADGAGEVPPQRPKPSEGTFGGAPAPRPPYLVIESHPADEKQNEAIRAKLEERIPMHFSTETPLENLKRMIAQNTIDEKAGLPSGIPIYIDPQGLKDADKTMASTFELDLEGIPLRITLKLALRQLGLIYRVEGGLLLIESADMEQPSSPLPQGAFQ